MSKGTRPVEDNEPWASILPSVRVPIVAAILLLLLWYYSPWLAEQVWGESVDWQWLGLGGKALKQLIWVALFVVILAIVKVGFRSPWKSFGVASPDGKDSKTIFLWAILAGGIYGLLGIGLLWGFEAFRDSLPADIAKYDTVVERLYHFAAINDHSLYAALMVIVAQPVMEEFFFRGLLQTHIRREFGPRVAVIGAAIIFAVAHDAIPVSQLIGGIVFGIAYEKTGKLWAPIALHILGNGTLFVISVLMENAIAAA